MSKPVVGRVWKFGDSVNTDEMYPGFALNMSISEASAHSFQNSRPGWSRQVRPGDIVLAGRDFGVGSSRPVPLLFRELGVAAVLAESITSLFFRNCINYGLPALAVEGIGTAFDDGDTAEVDISTGTVRNPDTGRVLRGAAYPPGLLEIVQAGGILNQLRSKGYLPPDLAGTGLGKVAIGRPEERASQHVAEPEQ